MSNRRCAFIHSPEIERFRYPPDCPFKPERAGKTYDRLRSLGLLSGAERKQVPPTKASRAELEAFHPAGYLDELEKAAGGDLTVEGLHMGFGTPDTPVFRDMYEFPSWGAGATLTAAEQVLAGEADVAFNPSGGFHHAMAAKAGGFCYVNDVVLGCMRLAEHGKRVLCLDVDGHHGDGTQEAFYARNDIMTVSLHQTGKELFPWGGFENETGVGEGKGYNVNVPLPADTFDDIYLEAFDRVVVPLLSWFDADVIVVELGMDTLKGDPLVHLALTNNACAEVINRLLATGKPIVATGGGGYHVDNTVRAWALSWQTFCGDADEHDLSLGMGGVLLESTEWSGGLRDRVLPVDAEQRRNVEAAVRKTIDTVKANVFAIHGLK